MEIRISCIHCNKVRTLNNINWEFSWNSSSRWLSVCEIPATLWVNILTHTMKCTRMQLQCLQCRSLHYRRPNITAFSRHESSNLIISLKGRCLSLWCIDFCFQTSVMLFVSSGKYTYFKKGQKNIKTKKAWCDTTDKRLLWKTLAEDIVIIYQTRTFILWKSIFLNSQKHKIRKLHVFLATVLHLWK